VGEEKKMESSKNMIKVNFYEELINADIAEKNAVAVQTEYGGSFKLEKSHKTID